jgi:hypothetical protein
MDATQESHRQHAHSRAVTGCVAPRLRTARVARRPARRPVVVVLRAITDAGRARIFAESVVRRCRAGLSGRLGLRPAPVSNVEPPRELAVSRKSEVPQGDMPMVDKGVHGEHLRCTATFEQRRPRVAPRSNGSSVPSLLPTWSRPASRPHGPRPFVGRQDHLRSSTLAQPGSTRERAGGFMENEFTIGGLSRSPLGRPRRSKRRWWGPTCPSCGERRPCARGSFVRSCFASRPARRSGRINQAPYSAPAHGHQTPSW